MMTLVWLRGCEVEEREDEDHEYGESIKCKKPIYSIVEELNRRNTGQKRRERREEMCEVDVATDGQILCLIGKSIRERGWEGVEADGMLSTSRIADDQDVR